MELSSECFVGKVEHAVVLGSEVYDDGVETLVDAPGILSPRVADGAGQLVGAVRMVDHVRCRDLKNNC